MVVDIEVRPCLVAACKIAAVGGGGIGGELDRKGDNFYPLFLRQLHELEHIAFRTALKIEFIVGQDDFHFRSLFICSSRSWATISSPERPFSASLLFWLRPLSFCPARSQVEH